MDPYIDRIKSSAEVLVKDVFPAKALELDNLINSAMLSTAECGKIFDYKELPKSEDFIIDSNDVKKEKDDKATPASKRRKGATAHETTAPTVSSPEKPADEVKGTKVVLFPNGGISCNPKITNLLNKIKPFIIHFLDASAILKLWIQILIPKVEDFKAELSLQIQEDSLAEIRGIETEVAAYLDSIYKYHAVRGKLVSKVAKYPHVEDYKQTVTELDEKMFMTIRLVSLELRNHYTTVHDILMKNMEKIKKPRSNNTISMY